MLKSANSYWGVALTDENTQETMATTGNVSTAETISQYCLRVSDGTAADVVHRYGLPKHRDVKEFCLCIADI